MEDRDIAFEKYREQKAQFEANERSLKDNGVEKAGFNEMLINGPGAEANDQAR